MKSSAHSRLLSNIAGSASIILGLIAACPTTGGGGIGGPGPGAPPPPPLPPSPPSPPGGPPDIVVRLMAVLRRFCMEPLEAEGSTGDNVDCERGTGCVGAAVDVLMRVAMVSW
jgi:hypothetical protein